MREISRAVNKKLQVNNYLGRALKFYASVRLEVRRVETLKQAGEAYANRTKVKVVKNKIAPPFKEAEFDIVYGKGIDYLGELVDIGAKENYIIKSGAWFSLPDGTKIGQGRVNAIEYLRQHPEIADSVKEQIYDKYFSKEIIVPEGDDIEAPEDLA